jgi:uncharacterized delta-60 repeat protein
MKGGRNSYAREVSRKLVAACVLTGLVGTAIAHSGDPDIHFGVGGKSVIDPIDATWSHRIGHHVVVDQTSRTLVCYNTSTQAAIEVLDETGTLDASFGTGGVLVLDDINDFKVDSKNRILIVNSDASYHGINVSRYLPDGTLDTSFGSSGSVDITGAFGGLTGIALQIDADDSAVIAGTDSTSPLGMAMVAAKVDRDGNLDPTFGDSGVSSVDAMPSGFDTIYTRALAIDSTHGIYISGYVNDSTSSSTLVKNMLVRLTNDGHLDHSFNHGQGYVITDPISDTMEHMTAAESITLDASKNIVIAGDSGKTTFQMFVARITPEGDLDATFDGGGIALLPNDSSFRDEEVNSVLVDGRGGIVLTGDGDTVSGDDRAVAMRLNDNGTVDTSFGVAGLAISSDYALGGQATFTHGQDVVIFADAPDGSSLYINQLIGYDPLKPLPPAGF